MQIKASYKYRRPWSKDIKAANKGNKGTLTNQSRLCSRFSNEKALTGLFNRERVYKDQWTQRMKKVFQQRDSHWILQLGTMFRKKETGTKWYRQRRKQFNDDAFRRLFNRAECTRSRKTETNGLGFYRRHSIYSRLFIFILCSSFRFLSHIFFFSFLLSPQSYDAILGFESRSLYVFPLVVKLRSWNCAYWYSLES